MDIVLIKLSVVAGILFLLGIWPTARNWAFTINPLWFLVTLIILSIRPLIKYFKNY